MTNLAAYYIAKMPDKQRTSDVRFIRRSHPRVLNRSVTFERIDARHSDAAAYLGCRLDCCESRTVGVSRLRRNVFDISGERTVTLRAVRPATYAQVTSGPERDRVKVLSGARESLAHALHSGLGMHSKRVMPLKPKSESGNAGATSELGRAEQAARSARGEQHD